MQKTKLLQIQRRDWPQAIWSTLLMMVALPFAVNAAEVRVSPAQTPAQAGLVDVRSLAPEIAVDMRYAGSNNFTGRVVPGYAAATCYLLRPAAEALARVARTLKAQGYRLQVFDCYRPVRAVQAFVAWAADLQEQSSKAQYYPRVDKRALLGDYIAETSGHSRGATLDLGLLDCRSGQCLTVDMGTDFDFFDARAHTDAPDIGAAQRRPSALAACDGGAGLCQLSDGVVALHSASRADARYCVRRSGQLIGHEAAALSPVVVGARQRSMPLVHCACYRPSARCAWPDCRVACIATSRNCHVRPGTFCRYRLPVLRGVDHADAGPDRRRSALHRRLPGLLQADLGERAVGRRGRGAGERARAGRCMSVACRRIEQSVCQPIPIRVTDRSCGSGRDRSPAAARLVHLLPGSSR